MVLGARCEQTSCTGTRWRLHFSLHRSSVTCSTRARLSNTWHVARCGRPLWARCARRVVSGSNVSRWTAATSCVKHQWGLFGTDTARAVLQMSSDGDAARTSIWTKGVLGPSGMLWTRLTLADLLLWVGLASAHPARACCLGFVPKRRKVQHARVRRRLDQVWTEEARGPWRMELGVERGDEGHGEAACLVAGPPP